MLYLEFALRAMLWVLMVLSSRSILSDRQLLVVVAEAHWMRSWQRSR